MISFYEGTYIQKFLSEITYSTTLRNKYDSVNKTSVGQSLSIYATDVNTSATLIDDVFPNLMSYILPIILAPFAIIFMTSLNPELIFVFIFSIILINSIIAVRQGFYFFNNKILSSTRVEFVNEWLQNMRVLRMLGWTNFLENKIQLARINETKNRISMVTNGTTMNAIGYSSPFFINILAVFLLIKIEGNNITAGQIFGLLWVFGVLLTRPMRMLPIMLVSISDCYTSIKRVENYWNQDLEEKSKPILNINKDFYGCFIKIRNLSYEKNGKLLLDSVSIDIKTNEFIAIIGEVGSGKTTLLQSLLNIINANFKTYEINMKSVQLMSLSELRSHFSYVPQDFFIINSNLRDNVAFEYNYSNKNDNEIIRALELSQFNFIEENKIFGLETEIGERGVNLSGGQKQRVAIARACFSNRQIILLDDCLSALDVNTEEKISEELLSGAWKDKTRILVTHRLSILPKCDRVLFIKNGKIVENGTFNEIYNRSEFVRDFVTSISIQE
jgi:ATP-binding cassette subfamily B multidrug efflux pump